MKKLSSSSTASGTVQHTRLLVTIVRQMVAASTSLQQGTVPSSQTRKFICADIRPLGYFFPLIVLFMCSALTYLSLMRMSHWLSRMWWHRNMARSNFVNITIGSRPDLPNKDGVYQWRLHTPLVSSMLARENWWFTDWTSCQRWIWTNMRVGKASESCRILPLLPRFWRTDDDTAVLIFIPGQVLSSACCIQF